ncbi:hypothetical protein NEFER03_2068 [Nematocida sp. LUAm3]|nr:hypothetical protein NEFER03_2068 [Nematocida sp. LUAm3]KAI5176214.1 hypothetical protein NEFER02_2020 [Nematocida sp. LUAm2]KAI5179202.1 hypothetical protein NEFER01_2059 [Nematocida sp. LUAm1]
MKNEQVTPEERKSILKKMFHTLRQSPMFSHYSIEHIRDSAIKSEQLTYNRSVSKQEYFQAMHAKLLKIEKSYVMNTEEILREISRKEKNSSAKPSEGYPRAYEESDSLNAFRGRHSEKQTQREDSVERETEEFSSKETLPPGRTYSIPVHPHRSSLNLDFNSSKSSILSEGCFLGEDLPLSSNPGITPLSMEHIPAHSPYQRGRAKNESVEDISLSVGNNYYGDEQIDQRLWKEIKPLTPQDLDVEKVTPMQNFLLNGKSLHRTGTAGSTNTITKMNATKMPISKTYKASVKTEKEESTSKKRVTSLFPQEETPQHVNTSAGVKDEVSSLWKEVDQINSVVDTHKNLFPKWEAQRKILYELESTIRMKAKCPGAPDVEILQGILQQMKKQAIVLTQEIKQIDGVPFKQRLFSISSAFSQKEEENSSYLFYA